MLIYDDEKLSSSPKSQNSSPISPKPSKSPNSKSPNSKSNSFGVSSYLYLKDIQRSTLKLKKLCERYNPDENSIERTPPIDQIKKSVDQLENVIYDLKTMLTELKLANSPTKTPKSVRFLLD